MSAPEWEPLRVDVVVRTRATAEWRKEGLWRATPRRSSWRHVPRTSAGRTKALPVAARQPYAAQKGRYGLKPRQMRWGSAVSEDLPEIVDNYCQTWDVDAPAG